ncbi:MAG: aminotransferase class III-fold pyridoxal phosphate-dependent enzyme [Candidatus Latescibacterota bacterium]
MRPADPDRQTSYAERLEHFGQIRGGKLFFPYLSSGSGWGALVAGGRSVKYDFIIGIGVHLWGHAHPDLLDTGVDAALSDTVMQGNLQQGAESESFAQALLGLAQQGGAPLNIASSPPRAPWPTRTPSRWLFRNTTRLTAYSPSKAVSPDVPWSRARLRIRPPTATVCPRSLGWITSPFSIPMMPRGGWAIKVLRGHLARFPRQHAAMFMELVQGERGSYPGCHDFFSRIIEVLRRNDIAVIIDEIQTFARLDRPFAFQHFGLDDRIDIVTVGKCS